MATSVNGFSAHAVSTLGEPPAAAATRGRGFTEKFETAQRSKQPISNRRILPPPTTEQQASMHVVANVLADLLAEPERASNIAPGDFRAKSIEDPDGEGASRTGSEIAIAIAFASPEPAKALHLGLPGAMFLSTALPIGKDSSDESGADCAIPAIDSAPVDETPRTKSGEVVFQLAVKPLQGAGSSQPPGSEEADQTANISRPPTALTDHDPARIAVQAAQEVAAGKDPEQHSNDRSPNQAARQEVTAVRAEFFLPHASTETSLSPSGTIAAEPAKAHPAPHWSTATASFGPPIPQSSMTQRIGLVVHGTDQFVRLDIRKSVGAMKITVHSDDPALAAQLRDSLPELMNRLDDRGLQARVTSLGSAPNATAAAQSDSGSGFGKGTKDSSADHNTYRDPNNRERHPKRAYHAWTEQLQQD